MLPWSGKLAPSLFNAAKMLTKAAPRRASEPTRMAAPSKTLRSAFKNRVRITYRLKRRSTDYKYALRLGCDCGLGRSDFVGNF